LSPSLDFPADSYRPILISCDGLDGKQKIGVFDNLIDEVSRLVLDLFNTSYAIWLTLLSGFPRCCDDLKRFIAVLSILFGSILKITRLIAQSVFSIISHLCSNRVASRGQAVIHLIIRYSQLFYSC
jgi:hypothetical protein